MRISLNSALNYRPITQKTVQQPSFKAEEQQPKTQQSALRSLFAKIGIKLPEGSKITIEQPDGDRIDIKDAPPLNEDEKGDMPDLSNVNVTITKRQEVFHRYPRSSGDLIITYAIPEVY